MVNPTGLYRPEFERDSCGFGLIAQMDGQSSHALVQRAITALERMTHRGAIAAVDDMMIYGRHDDPQSPLGSG